MSLFYGAPVFSGAGHGSVCRWSEVGSGRQSPPGDLILTSRHLDNPLAEWAIRHGVSAILTDSGSFACHAANLLRAARVNGHTPTSWITDCRGIADVASRMHVHYTYDGRVECSSRCSSGAAADDPHSVRRQVISCSPGPNREIVAYDADSNSLWRCYWPHRRYDALLASVMVAGLQHDAALSPDAATCQIRHGADGLLWCDAHFPPLEQLIARARDLTQGRHYAHTQAAVYDELLGALTRDDITDSTRSLPALVSLMKRYFSHFLAFHNTYEHVFVELVRRCSHISTDMLAVDLLNAVLLPELILWQQREHLALPNHKDLFAGPSHVPAPPFGVAMDTERTVARTRAQLRRLPHGRPADDVLEYLEYAAQVCVVKEWKFWLNKMLFSRFANSVSPALTRIGLSEAEARRLMMDELMAAVL